MTTGVVSSSLKKPCCTEDVVTCTSPALVSRRCPPPTASPDRHHAIVRQIVRLDHGPSWSPRRTNRSYRSRISEIAFSVSPRYCCTSFRLDRVSAAPKGPTRHHGRSRAFAALSMSDRAGNQLPPDQWVSGFPKPHLPMTRPETLRWWRAGRVPADSLARDQP